MRMQLHDDDGRARFRRLSLRLREQLCSPPRTPRCRSSSNSAAASAPARATVRRGKARPRVLGSAPAGRAPALAGCRSELEMRSRRGRRQPRPPVAALLPKTDDERRLVTILGAEPYSGCYAW